jgi:hypothetical protein
MRLEHESVDGRHLLLGSSTVVSYATNLFCLSREPPLPGWELPVCGYVILDRLRFRG